LCCAIERDHRRRATFTRNDASSLVVTPENGKHRATRSRQRFCPGILTISARHRKTLATAIDAATRARTVNARHSIER
jgi:hypothetical protein